MKQILDVCAESDFSVDNIPFGIFHLSNEPACCARVGTRVGDRVLDLALLAEKKLLSADLGDSLRQCCLNKFIGLGKAVTSKVREEVQALLKEGSALEKLAGEELCCLFVPVEQTRLLMPVNCGDYTDFYASKEHASNIGKMLRDPSKPLNPNWLWIPIGYHGRASSIVASPAEFVRPRGQKKPADAEVPVFGESGRVDFELEIGCIIGQENQLGNPVPVAEAGSSVFGYVFLNDVSLRDIQAWEYVPLGPFTAKNCISVISPWVVTAEALAETLKPLPAQEPQPLEYLRDPNYGGFDIPLEVYLKTAKADKEHKISSTNMKHLYWTFAQMIAHHTVTGCNLRVGDILGSGTISGEDRNQAGSLMELSWNGKEPLTLEGGETRTFWEKGDEVIFRGGFQSKATGKRIGFGECRVKMI